MMTVRQRQLNFLGQCHATTKHGLENLAKTGKLVTDVIGNMTIRLPLGTLLYAPKL